MKKKIMLGIAGLLVASSSMFAGWGVSVGVGGGYYGPRAGVVVAGGHGYYAPYHYYPRPYAYVAPGPVYAAPAPAYAAPVYAAPAWIPGYWDYRPYGRVYIRGHWGRR